MKQLALGIIGLGAQGRISLSNALNLKEARVLAVSDTSRSSLNYAKTMGVEGLYSSYDELLKQEEIDAVVVNLPNFLHLNCSVEAAEAGKHILLEKPLARTVSEGEEILSSVRRNGVRLMMGYDLRFVPGLQEMHDDIADGLFGQVELAEATNVSGGPFSPRNDRAGPVQVPSWWFDKKLAGGGALLDLGSHMIDLLTWYFGDVAQTKGFLGHMFNLEIEDSATCVLKFKGGPVATVKTGWFSKDFFQSVQICGTAKNTGLTISSKNVLQTVWKGVTSKIGIHHKNPYYSKLQHFVNSVLRDEQPLPSGEDGVHTLRVIESVYEHSSVE